MFTHYTVLRTPLLPEHRSLDTVVRSIDSIGCATTNAPVPIPNMLGRKLIFLGPCLVQAWKLMSYTTNRKLAFSLDQKYIYC